MRQKNNSKNGNGKRVIKRGEFFSFLVAAILIVGFFAASHYMFYGFNERRMASVQPVSEMRCHDLLPFLNSGSNEARFKASVALASCGYPQGIDSLIGFLDDSNETLQKAAAFTLLGQELTLNDPQVVAKIEKNRDKILKLIHPNLEK